MRTIRRVAPELPTKFHTLADLKRHTGLKTRILQVWGDAGVIIAEGDSLHSGKGTPRRYRTAELIIAQLLRPCHEVGIPLGHLVRLAGVLRQALALGTGSVRGTAEDVWRPQERHPTLRGVTMHEPGVPQIRAALHRAVLDQGNNFLALAFTNEVITANPLTDAHGPISFDPEEFFQAEQPRPRIAFLLDLRIIAGLWEEVAD